MQMLLRPAVSSSCSSAPLLCTTVSRSFSSSHLPFNFNNFTNPPPTHKFPFSFYPNSNYSKAFHSISLSLSSSSMAASAFAGSSLSTSLTRKPLTLNHRYLTPSSSTCCVCSCRSLIHNNTLQSLTWLSPKYPSNLNGSLKLTTSSLHSPSDGSFPTVPGGDCEEKSTKGLFSLPSEAEEEGEKEKEKPLRLNRRQKGSSMPSNPDLLTIPGVGPRNLRKLVQNGIAGVDQLKQLYRDKAFLFFLPFVLAAIGNNVNNT